MYSNRKDATDYYFEGLGWIIRCIGLMLILGGLYIALTADWQKTLIVMGSFAAFFGLPALYAWWRTR